MGQACCRYILTVDILGSQNIRLLFPLSLEHFVLHIYATGFADYTGRHSDTCTVSKSIKRLARGKAAEKHGGSRLTRKRRDE